MHVINACNVNDALPQGLLYLRDHGVTEPSRNGPVLVAPGPVATVYHHPLARVLFDPMRNANLFFHLFEAFWILAGREDVRFLSLFNSRMSSYSDDGEVFHGSYGYRLRSAFGFDQIEEVCKMLHDDPTTRRSVLQIWDANLDLGTDSKDLPCNDMVMMRVKNGALDITVCNRSNDAVWGAYGTNAVQFSFLQEYIAGMARLRVGEYTQMSHNFHVYTELPFWQQWLEANRTGYHIGTDRYMLTEPSELVTISKFFLDDPVAANNDMVSLFSVFDNCSPEEPFAWVDVLREDNVFRSYSFVTVVMPMLVAWAKYKSGDKQGALECMLPWDQSVDWIRGATEWLRRALENKNAA